MAFDLWQEMDILARDQYFGRPRYENSPERRLLAAVLLVAFEDFELLARDCDSLDDPQLRELTTWFFGHDTEWPFSFVNVCTHLNLDVGCIRSRLRRLVENHSRQTSPGALPSPDVRRTARNGTRPAEAA